MKFILDKKFIFINIFISYFYIFSFFIIIYLMDVYDHSKFFNFGIPFNFINKEINSYYEYILLIFIFFLHKVIYNPISEIFFPYIIETLKNKNVLFISKFKQRIIISLFSIYNLFDLFILFLSLYSQITFFISIIFGDIVSFFLYESFNIEIDLPNNIKFESLINNNN